MGNKTAGVRGLLQKTARDKNFELGDKVLVLIKDSTNKLKAKWQGIGEVTAVCSENSYLVLMSNKGVRRFHANHLRHFKSRVNNIGVIFESD